MNGRSKKIAHDIEGLIDRKINERLLESAGVARKTQPIFMHTKEHQMDIDRILDGYGETYP